MRVYVCVCVWLVNCSMQFEVGVPTYGAWGGGTTPSPGDEHRDKRRQLHIEASQGPKARLAKMAYNKSPLLRTGVEWDDQ